MARRELAVPENVPGDLFVDETCIECDTCRELAPEVFGSLECGQSFVQEQPANDASWRRALHAVVSCPTASIGRSAARRKRRAIFPSMSRGRSIAAATPAKPRMAR